MEKFAGVVYFVWILSFYALLACEKTSWAVLDIAALIICLVLYSYGQGMKKSDEPLRSKKPRTLLS